MERTWFITGISSGFGRIMAEQLLERGDRVAGTVRRLDAAGGLKARHGDNLSVLHLDVTDTAEVRKVVDAAFARFGRIDVVVNNAGYGLFGAAEELTDEQITDEIDTNLIGSIQVVRAALPHLRAQGGGRLIQISTVGGQAAFPGGSLYHASKWGIEGFMEAVMQEVAVFNIGVTIVEPGGARTEFRYGSSKLSPKLSAYDASPARNVHRMIEAGTAVPLGDPARMAAHIIASADQHPAPLRLALGSDAYRAMHKALTDRLALLESQEALAASTDG